MHIIGIIGKSGSGKTNFLRQNTSYFDSEILTFIEVDTGFDRHSFSAKLKDSPAFVVNPEGGDTIKISTDYVIIDDASNLTQESFEKMVFPEGCNILLLFQSKSDLIKTGIRPERIYYIDGKPVNIHAPFEPFFYALCYDEYPIVPFGSEEGIIRFTRVKNEKVTASV